MFKFSNFIIYLFVVYYMYSIIYIVFLLNY
jgi:hypothetical protein